MSGHSHWKTIKYKKAAADIAKSKVMSKLLNEIAIAAKGGADPDSNYRLRAAIDKAKEYKVGVDAVDRAIKRGSGQSKEALPEEVYYEAYGPKGVALVIKVITDSRNRALNEVKHLLSEYGAKFADSGSVKWMFEEKGVVTLDIKTVEEQTLLELIESGVENYEEDEGRLVLYTDHRNLAKVRDCAAQKNIPVVDASLELVPKTKVPVDEGTKRRVDDLADAIAELDDVDNVFTNAA